MRGSMRWDCEKSGCFNKLLRPKIEVFSPCFPGAISFGDVDGMVEINSHALFLEWKTYPEPLSRGQSMAYENLSRRNSIQVVLVAGNAETMEVSHVGWYAKGKFYDWKEATIEDVKSKIKDWVRWAKDTHPIPCAYVPYPIPRETTRTD